MLHAQAALYLVGEADPPLRAKIVNTLANILDDRGRSAEAIVCYRQALQLFDQAGDRRAAGLVARNLGTALHRLGDTAEAERLLERGVAIAREDNDRRGLAYGLANLARQRFLRGDFAAAKCVAAEAKETAHSENYLDALFMSLYYLWKISLGETQKALCRAYAERLRVLHRKLETRSAEADAWLREHEQASTRGVCK